MSYLICFKYEHWCQGPEWVTETILVNNAKSFETACKCIQLTFEKAKDFVNLTYSSSIPFDPATTLTKLVQQP